jgi:hypothetical protein
MTIVDFVGHLVVTVSLREYGVLVPRHFNDGNPVPPELRRGLEAAMRQAFNGFTALRGLDGSWADDDGREYPDTIDEYRVAACQGDWPATGAAGRLCPLPQQPRLDRPHRHQRDVRLGRMRRAIRAERSA